MKTFLKLLVCLFLCCPQVWAQCDNGPCYTTNGPQVTWMMPAAAAQRGIVTMTNTVYAANVAGSKHSHNAQYTAGTQVGIDVTTMNAESRSWYFTINEGSPQGQGSVSGFSGTQTWTNPNAWLTNAGQVGDLITYVNTAYAGLNETGAFSQDRLTFKVIAGSGPSIVFEDQMPTNFIVQASFSGGGGSMLNDFTVCQGGNQDHCINATHTPVTTLTLTNNNSGEVQNHPQHQSGNIARSNESVSFSDSITISALPNDALTYEEDDTVFCSISGPVGVAGTGSSPVSVEWAWTVAQKLPSPPCEQVPGGGIRCYMQYACTPDSSPPDYRPVQIFTLQFGTVDMPDYWLSGNLCFSIFGAPYLCPGSQIAGGIPGSGNWWQFVLAPGIPWTNKPFECTKASAGKGVTIPWPF